MKICVPSKNRAGKTQTQRILKNAIFFVPKDEVKLYKNKIKNKIIEVPKKYNGITKTRNFILKTYPNENILFIDDDTRQAGYFDEGNRISFFKDDFNDILEKEFNRLFQVTKELGFKIWGAETGGSKFANHSLTPFSFRGVINCSFLGLINDGEFYFDENFEVKEDYEILLRHFKKKGGHLKVRHFFWSVKHWNNQGGCVDYRTDEMEKNCIEKLKKRYPFMIKKSNFQNEHQISIKWD